MLSVLRKIRRSHFLPGKVRTYLAYAVGEIALIVVGILLAVQVSNWNEARINKKKERLLMEEIHAEFLYNQADLRDKKARYSGIEERLTELRELFPLDIERIDRESLGQYYLDDILSVARFDASLGSIAALKNSNSFELISNDELRSLLIEFEDIYADYSRKEARSLDFVENFMNPYFGARVRRPFDEGFKDERVDLSFLGTIEFESLIDNRRRRIRNFLELLEPPDRNIERSINRIVELSKPVE